jgi:hypothetical protein
MCIRCVLHHVRLYVPVLRQTWGLEQDDTTGLAVQRVKRPLVSVTFHLRIVLSAHCPLHSVVYA